MLKGLDPLLSPDLLRVLRAMGHGDEIAIVDGNYPAEADARRLVRLDGHGSPRILDAILSVMPVDDMVPEAEWRPSAYLDPKRMEPVFEDFTAVLLKYEPKQKIVPLTGDAFYNKVKACFAIVASSEARLYGNIVVKKGVTYPSNSSSPLWGGASSYERREAAGWVGVRECKRQPPPPQPLPTRERG